MTLEQINTKISQTEDLLTTIETAIESGMGQSSFSLFGRSYSFRSMDELLSAHRYFTRKLRSLQECARRKEGKPSRSVIHTRFC